MVNNITSANERWTEYDYEICVANDWDTIMDKCWWHTLQIELQEIEGFYRNYKQCDTKLANYMNKEEK